MNNITLLIDDRAPSSAGILAGISKGKKWLFPDIDPTFAVTYSYCVGGCGLSGRIMPEDELQIKAFLHNVFTQLKQEGIHEFEFSAENSELYEAMFRLFPDKEIHSEMEYSYRSPDVRSIDISKREAFELIEVDEQQIELFEHRKYENSSLFMDRYLNSWNSKEEYLRYSKSYVAVSNNKVLGVIFGSARIANIITIDIEVDKEQRNKGIATMLGQAMMKECQKENLILQWDHVESNKGSRRLANKLGFVPFKARPYYWFEI